MPPCQEHSLLRITPLLQAKITMATLRLTQLVPFAPLLFLNQSWDFTPALLIKCISSETFHHKDLDTAAEPADQTKCSQQ